jgi:CheY-like chemotaxis protein
MGGVMEVKIFLAEDNQEMRNALVRILNDNEYPVVVVAESLNDALAKVNEAKKLGVNVAVLDGVLWDLGTTEDGHKIADALKKEIPEIKIISFSASFKLLTWGDFNLDKCGGPQKLLSLLHRFESDL